MTRPPPRPEKLLARANGLLPIRLVRRFIAVSGYDHALALATQAFVALIPMLIIVAAVTPARSRDAARTWLIDQSRLSGDAAAAVSVLFERPSDPTQTATVLGAALLVISVVGFTRTLQRTFLAAWRLPSLGLRGFSFGLLAAVVLVAEVATLVLMAPLMSALPAATLLTLAVQAGTAVLLWWPIQWLLICGRIAWRDLLPGAVVTGVGQTAVMAMSGLYLPVTIAHQAARFGSIGVAFVLVSWLVALGVLLVGAAVLGAEVADAPARPETS